MLLTTIFLPVVRCACAKPELDTKKTMHRKVGRIILELAYFLFAFFNVERIMTSVAILHGSENLDGDTVLEC